jgi:plastocyanin
VDLFSQPIVVDVISGKDNDRVTFALLHPATHLRQPRGVTLVCCNKKHFAMNILSWRAIISMATATYLILYPKVAGATTFDVTIGPNGNLVFSPSSVTIHTGNKVKWTWGSSGHTTTSGSPGMPNGIWDSGLHSQGETFTHTFNSAGTFPYYCVPHGGCCNMVGRVIVLSDSSLPNALRFRRSVLSQG